MSKRKRYSPEYKREAVEPARRSDTSARQVALDIGISPNILRRLLRRAQARPSQPPTLPHERRSTCRSV
ncbi:transposase [Algiphilus aromaticivorans]|uniref:transposase n=1 Tax=Algiphilus aromaticivorans TaxID=382454 RepID=UPI0012EC01F5